MIPDEFIFPALTLTNGGDWDDFDVLLEEAGLVEHRRMIVSLLAMYLGALDTLALHWGEPVETTLAREALSHTKRRTDGF